LTFHFYHNYIYYYGIPILVTLLILISGFVIKNSLGKNLFFQIFFLFIGFILISILAFFTGWNSGIQFYFLALIPIPFFFEKAGKIKIYSVIFILAIISVVIFYFLFNTNPVFPLPVIVSSWIFNLTIGFIFISTVLLVAYTIIYYKFTGAIVHCWHLISEFGNERFSSQTGKKYNILNN
jgi:hypothetical protein